MSTWGFRRVASVDCDLVNQHPDDEESDEVLANEANDAPQVRSPRDINWVKQDAFKWFKVEGATAQVMPYEFVTKMSELAQEFGAKLIVGRAESIILSQDKQAVQAVLFRPAGFNDEQQLLASHVVIAAGPWTSRLCPSIPIIGELSTAIIVQPKQEISGVVLFFDPGHLDPQTPHNKTVYISGSPVTDLELPDTTAEVHPDPVRVNAIHKRSGLVSNELQRSTLLKGQACFRPIVNIDGWDKEATPLMGQTAIRGLLLAAGAYTIRLLVARC
ncbi:hypothetical protein LTR86_010413 [Recurvomyces mirabilis]|nr:hypothetical protein LTR86_010413 [Recurvomyces mirabilis]